MMRPPDYSEIGRVDPKSKKHSDSEKKYEMLLYIFHSETVCHIQNSDRVLSFHSREMSPK